MLENGLFAAARRHFPCGAPADFTLDIFLTQKARTVAEESGVDVVGRTVRDGWTLSQGCKGKAAE
jgi:hypothetical protein